jgi:stage II sporulation protein D
MKKLAYCAAMMIVIVILLPLLIVKGCGHPTAEKPPEGTITGSELKISVYDTISNTSSIMNLEDYIKGVVAAEMPADFDMEALKAQAVAARTFAYGRLTGVYQSKQGVHDGITICTDSTHCQAWISKENAMKKWNIFFSARNWAKIEKAVNGTKGMIVVYKGNIANTLFHASSPGRTENNEDVWSGTAVPYLRSVESSGEENAKGYKTSIIISNAEFVEKLKKAYADYKFGEDIFKTIKILGNTEGGRVKSLKIGDTTLTGTQFRTLYKLRSAAFSIKKNEDGSLKITTTGYGHGVGMSQWGADSLAKKGATYIEILKHYYTGVDVISINEYAAKSGVQ